MTTVQPSAYLGKSFGQSKPNDLESDDESEQGSSNNHNRKGNLYARPYEQPTLQNIQAQPVYIVNQTDSFTWTRFWWFLGIVLIITTGAYFYWLSVECNVNASFELNETVRYTLNDVPQLKNLDRDDDEEEEEVVQANVANTNIKT